jgi:WD40 repeat protein
MPNVLSLLVILVAFLLSAGAATAAGDSSPAPILRIEAGVHLAEIRRVDHSRDGRLAITGSDDKTARLWALPPAGEAAAPRLLRVLRIPVGEGFAGRIYAVALSPDGKLAAIGGDDIAPADDTAPEQNFVYIYDTASGELQARLGPLAQQIDDLVFSPDGELLAAGLGETEGVRIWRVGDRRLLLADRNYSKDIYGLAFDRADRLAVTSDDGDIRLYTPLAAGWTGSAGKVAAAESAAPPSPAQPAPVPSELPEAPGGLKGIFVVPGLAPPSAPPAAATGSEPAAPRRWDGEAAAKCGEAPAGRGDLAAKACFALSARVTAQGGHLPYGIDFSPDGSRLAVGFNDGPHVDVLDGSSLQRRFAINSEELDNGELTSVAWSPDGRVLYATGSYDEEDSSPILAFGDSGKGERRALAGPGNTVMDIGVLGDGRLLVASAEPVFGLMTPAGERLFWQEQITLDPRPTADRYAENLLLSAEGKIVRFPLRDVDTDPYLFAVDRLSLTRCEPGKPCQPPALQPAAATPAAIARTKAAKSDDKPRDKGKVDAKAKSKEKDKGKARDKSAAKGKGKGKDKGEDKGKSARHDGGKAKAAAKPQRLTLHPPRTDGLAIESWQDDESPTLHGLALELDEDETARALAIASDNKSFFLGADWSLSRFDSIGKPLWRIDVPSTIWCLNLSGDNRLAIAAADDGTIRWYRTSDGSELLALFIDVRDKRWVAFTPSGYYAASKGGEALIGWQNNGDGSKAPVFTPASQLAAKYYRPDVVQRILDTLDEAKALSEADASATSRPETP